MGNGCTKGKDEPTACSRAIFTFERVVGKGGFGRVWKVKHKKTKLVYALKVIDKARVIGKRSVQSILNEKEILLHLLEEKCSFIVNMHCAFQDRQNLYLLIDYLDAGDLRYYINRGVGFNEEQIRFLVRCLLEGLRCLHSKNIIHRDIKPENIIFDGKGYAKITDLGIARYWRPENSQQTSGTPGYMAPEVLLRQNHSFATDFYAVGVIAYQLLVGKRPYAGRDRKTIREEMIGREAKVPAACAAVASEECCEFINKLLQRNTKKRLGYNGFSQIHSHPWLAWPAESQAKFIRMEMASPITPLQIILNPALQENTEPDEVWRENMLLLKRKDIQLMFEGYDYSLEEKFDPNCSTLPTMNGHKFY